MGKNQAQFQPKDYDQTTELVERLVLPQPLEPTAPVREWYPDALNSPEYQAGVYSHAQVPAYPVLPRAPFRKYHGQPPGGAVPAYTYGRAHMRYRSPIPGLVRFCFVLIQLTLLGRVVCMILGVTVTNLWLSLLFFASDLFVLPLRWLAANVDLGLLAGTSLLLYLEFLLAILAYGIVSRLLVGLLKALFRG